MQYGLDYASLLDVPLLRFVSLLLLLLNGLPVLVANCAYRENAFGHTRYQCGDGKRGTLREDTIGNIKDSCTGTTWRYDALGNLKGSDGTTYSKDALGAASTRKPEDV